MTLLPVRGTLHLACGWNTRGTEAIRGWKKKRKKKENEEIEKDEIRIRSKGFQEKMAARHRNSYTRIPILVRKVMETIDRINRT